MNTRNKTRVITSNTNTRSDTEVKSLATGEPGKRRVIVAELKTPGDVLMNRFEEIEEGSGEDTKKGRVSIDLGPEKQLAWDLGKQVREYEVANPGSVKQSSVRQKHKRHKKDLSVKHSAEWYINEKATSSGTTR
jgi:hypothetical protein